MLYRDVHKPVYNCFVPCVVHAEITVGFEKGTYIFDEVSGLGNMGVYLSGQLERDIAVIVSTIPGTATGIRLEHFHSCTLTHAPTNTLPPGCKAGDYPFLLTAAGADYTSILSQVLTFNSTITLLPITLRISVDQLVEQNETLSAVLELQKSLDRVHLSPVFTNITIADSDSK